MKGVGMAHLEAVRRLKGAGVRLQRTVHISFVPAIKVTCTGPPGHGSRVTAGSAGEKGGVQSPEIKSTKIDGSVPFWNAIKEAVNEMGMTVTALICSGATDARFVRRQGIPAINLTPFDDTPLLIHGDDERIHVDSFKKGIETMNNILRAVADCV
ncbi:Aminoacylase-1 [Operophtera brumata]|uniref:Aminoacylase-1 n=1 Tax=Operophtera brumata TaxID=104452 RepID=A0A0L7LBX4_OPEBR|nr:Aminoacylase-1 [Operophtera brumata]